jgi:ribonuclease BN (tRNA processing enzyme)
MKLYILGNGSPRPTPKGERFGTSCIVEFGDERIMVDCGPGATYKMARMGMRPTEVNTVFLTHHHSDHIVDFPCFALLRIDLDPGDLPPLRVFGPPPTVQYAERLFGERGAFHPDIVARQKHPVSHHGHIQRGGKMPRPGMKVEAHDLESGAVVKGDGWQARAVEVPHIGPYLTTLSFRIDTDEGSVLFLCDAADCPEVRELAKGVDTFVTGLVGLNYKENAVDAEHPIHGVSADISEVVDIAVDGGIPRIVLIHGAPPAERAADMLRQGYGDKGYDGLVLRPDEMTTIEL